MPRWRSFPPVRCLRRLPPLMDAHHAHSSRFYLAILEFRRRSGRRLDVDVLGIRADQAAPSSRSLRGGRQISSPERPAIAHRPKLAASRRPLDKKQGRRRSITPTALPAPDIEIGLRHPVNCMMPGNITGICDPVHNRREKVLTALWGGGRPTPANWHACAATPRCAFS
jgi:hypothetical protein